MKARAEPTAEEIAALIAATPKYRFTCRQTIARIARAELQRLGDGRLALESTRRKLHQISAAYIPATAVTAAHRMVEAAGAGDDLSDLAARVLRLHGSTAERFPFGEEFYRRVFAVTGVPETLLDLGCGLNPFAIPWMGLGPGTAYHAIDIHSRLIDTVGRFQGLIGQRPLARVQDLIADPPVERADVALLLKVLPVLEQQVPGFSWDLIAGLAAARIVVSFPLRTLGGRRVGMPRTYGEWFEGGAAGRFNILEKLVFPNEMVYIIRKQPNGQAVNRAGRRSPSVARSAPSASGAGVRR